MILIVDNTKRKMRSDIRTLLLEKSVPCAICNTNSIDIFLPSGACIVTEKYLFDTVRYMSSMHGLSPLYLYNGSDDIFEYVSEIAEGLLQRIKEIESEYHLVFDDGDMLFCGRTVVFTKTELRIIRMLLLSEDWQRREKIALYCMKDPLADEKSIAVHICNINKKALKSAGRILIEKRRYCGYRIVKD